MTNVPNEELAIDRWPVVSRRTGYRSKSHVEQLEKKAEFPRSVKIGVRAKGWVRSEITAWIEARIEVSRSEQSRRSSSQEA